MFGDWYLLVPVLLPLLSGLLLTLYKPLGEGKARNPVTLVVLCLNVVALLPVLFGGERTLTLFTLSDSLPVFLRVDDTGRWFSAIPWPLSGLRPARIPLSTWPRRNTCGGTTVFT